MNEIECLPTYDCYSLPEPNETVITVSVYLHGLMGFLEFGMN